MRHNAAAAAVDSESDLRISSKAWIMSIAELLNVPWLESTVMHSTTPSMQLALLRIATSCKAQLVAIQIAMKVTASKSHMHSVSAISAFRWKLAIR